LNTKKLVYCLILLLVIFVSMSAEEEKSEAVNIKQLNIYEKPDKKSTILDAAGIGTEFHVISQQKNWLEVQDYLTIGWIQKEFVVLDSDPNFAGKVIVKSRCAQLTSKMGGKDNKVVKDLELGEIAEIISFKYKVASNYEVRLADGTTGWVSKKQVTKLGASSQLELDEQNFFEKTINKRGTVFYIFAAIDKWGEKSKATKNTVTVLAVILVILPFVLTSCLVNFFCSIRIVPTWLINLLLIIAAFNSLRWLFPIYMSAPIFKSFMLAVFFQLFYILWIGRELKKIQYHRCPNCHTMFATSDKGTISLGGWKWKTKTTHSDGSTSTSNHSQETLADVRKCLACGHVWKVFKIVRS